MIELYRNRVNYDRLEVQQGDLLTITARLRGESLSGKSVTIKVWCLDPSGLLVNEEATVIGSDTVTYTLSGVQTLKPANFPMRASYGVRFLVDDGGGGVPTTYPGKGYLDIVNIGSGDPEVTDVFIDDIASAQSQLQSLIGQQKGQPLGVARLNASSAVIEEPASKGQEGGVAVEKGIDVRARATPAQIAGTDSVADLIEQAVADAMAGNKILELGPGIWRFDRTATLEDCSGLTIRTAGFATVIKPDPGIDDGAGIGSPFYFKGTSGDRLSNIHLGSFKLERTGTNGYIRFAYCDDCSTGLIIDEGGQNSSVSGSNSDRIRVAGVSAPSSSGGGSCLSLRDCKDWWTGPLYCNGGSEVIDLFRCLRISTGDVIGRNLSNEAVDCGASSYCKFGHVDVEDSGRAISFKVEAGIACIGNEVESVRAVNIGTAASNGAVILFSQDSGAPTENYGHRFGKVYINTTVASIRGIVGAADATYRRKDITFEEVDITTDAGCIDIDYADRLTVGKIKLVSLNGVALQLDNSSDYKLGEGGDFYAESQGTDNSDNGILLQGGSRGKLTNLRALSAKGNGIYALDCIDLVVEDIDAETENTSHVTLYGGRFRRCDGLTIRRGAFRGTLGYGLYIEDTDEKDTLGANLEWVKAHSTDNNGLHIEGVRRVRGVGGEFSSDAENGVTMSSVKDVRWLMPTVKDCYKHGVFITIIDDADWNGKVDIEIIHPRVQDIGQQTANAYSAFRIDQLGATAAEGIRLHRGYVHDLAGTPTSRIAHWNGMFTACEDTVERGNTAGERTGSLSATANLTMLYHGRAALVSAASNTPIGGDLTGALVDPTLSDLTGGTAATSLVAIAGTGDDVDLNNNFASLKTAIENLNDNQRRVLTKQNEILNVLKNANLMASA